MLERLATARWDDGDRAGSLDAARRRVELDPLDEAGQRRLIELMARSGDRAGAIGRYRTMVALFDRELGVPPLRETTELYEAVREGTLSTGTADPGGGRSEVTLQPVAVPVSLPLVGRATELDRLVRAWRSAETDGRLALVEGEAGIGKTRLGEALASVVRVGGGRVMASRGYPGEGAVAYAPIAGLLRAGVGLPGGPERLASLDEPVRLELGRLLDLPPAIAGRCARPARRCERPRPLPRCPGIRAGGPGGGTVARPALGRRPPSRR